MKNSVAFLAGANCGLGSAFANVLVALGTTKVYAGMRTIDATAKITLGIGSTGEVNTGGFDPFSELIRSHGRRRLGSH